MDFDLFLTSPRWEILQIIALKPSSPIEIAQKLNTTVSYVSQQLKLLDAANLLSKEKTGSVEKGKPRTLFGLSSELVYVSALTRKFANKKLIHINEHHKNTLKIWIFTDPLYHASIEKILLMLEEDLNEIEAIFLENSASAPKLVIVSDSKKARNKCETINEKLITKIECVFVTKPQLKRFSHDFLLPLHDKNEYLNELKGGKLN